MTTPLRDQLEWVLSLLRRSLRFWKRALLVFVLGTALAVPFVFTRPRQYRSETVVLYQETIRSNELPGGEGGGEGARRVGARLREVLLSRQSLEPIIQDMHLYDDKIVRGELIGAVEEMRKNIQFRAKEGDAFEIAFTGETPQQAQEVTKRLGETMLKDTTVRRSEQANTVKQFLNQESARNEADLKQKEAELAAFITLHPEFARRLGPAGANDTTGTTGTRAGGGGFRGSTSDPILTVLEARQARLEKQLKAKPDPGVAPKPAATFTPPPDSAELVAARRDYQEKSAQFTDKHPDVIAARNRLRAAEQAQAEVNAAAERAWREKNADTPPPPTNAVDEAALRKDLADVQNQIANRRAQLAKLAPPAPSSTAAGAATAPPPAPTFTGSVETEVEFNRLQREVGEARDRQAKLDDRLFRASINASSVSDDRNIQVSILDPAYLPVRPVSKSRTLMLGALLAVVLLLSVATAVASAQLEDRLYERRDIERLDILPVLAVIPPAPRDNVRRLRAPSDPGM